MSKITQTEVIAVIQNALEIKNGQLGENTRAEEIASWDSLGQLSILVALDKLFGGKIAKITDMASANSIPKILNILKQNSLL
jgi:acyl carrier protein